MKMNNMNYSKLAIIDILKEFLNVYRIKLSSYWSNLSNREREIDRYIDKKENLEINIYQLNDIISLCEKELELLINDFSKIIFRSRVYIITIIKVNYYYKVTLSIEYNGEIIPNMFTMNFYDNNVDYNRFESSSSHYIKELYTAIEIDEKENLIYE